MPQFELDNFLPQLFWLAIFFAILYFAVIRPTLPKLGRVIDAREAQVVGDLDIAERVKAEADGMQADYDAGVAMAHADARAQIGAAQAASARHLEARLAESSAMIEAKTAEADARIAMARSAAMSQIEDVATDVAADIVERLTGNRPGVGELTGAARAALA